MAALKGLNADLRANEQAYRILAAARREQAEQERASAAAAAQAVHESSAEYSKMAQAFREAASASQPLIAIENTLESEAEQLTAALNLESGALLHAAQVTGSYSIECSAAASAQTKLATGAKATHAGIGQLQQSIMAGSFAFQDFTATSGDLGAKLNSISNNIPTLLVGLGGIGIAAGIAFTAGVALYRNWDTLTNLFEEKNPFPKVAGDISGMKRELDAGKEAMEKFEKAGSGTAAELEKYNALRERTAFLETEIADQTERQGRLKKLLEAPTQEAEGRGKGFDEATQGKYQETKDKIEAALDQRDQAELEAAWESRTASVQRVKAANLSAEEELRQINSINGVYTKQKADIEARIIDNGKTAAELMERLHRGDEEAHHSLDLLIAGTGDLFGNLRKEIADANPHIKKLVDQAEKEIEQWLAHEEKTARAAGKVIDDQAKAQVKAAEMQTAAETELAAFVEHQTADRKKAAAHAFDMEMKAIVADAEEAKLRAEATAKRIEQFTGEHAKDQFQATVAQQAALTGQDPEKIATAIAGRLAGAWAQPPTQGGLGANREGAAMAAQQLAARAGFRVTLPQIAAAQAALPRIDRFGRPVRAQRPAVGKKPALRGAALLRQQAAARQRTAAKQQAFTDIDAFTKQQTKGRPKPKPEPAGQANIAPAVQGTQDAVATTQAAQARDQQIVAAAQRPRPPTPGQRAASSITRAREQQAPPPPTPGANVA